jgi:hypothetical protein
MSGPVFKFCAHRLVFVGTEGVGSRFHVLRARARFKRYRGCRVPFSNFALHDSLSAVPWASVPVFMFCAPGLVFGCTEGVRSRFHVLRTRTRLRPYRVCRVPFTCLALPDSFSTVTRRRVPFSYFTRPYSFSIVPRASGPVFMFCASALIFCGTEGVGSRFHVLRAQTRFRLYLRRRAPFSFFRVP